MHLLPMPKEMILKEGSFTILPNTEIVLNASCNSTDLQAALELKKEIVDSLKIDINVNKSLKKENNSIYLRKTKGNSECYKLTVGKEGIEIEAADEAGLFYGVQTLRQIIRNNGACIPALVINDEPYFAFRGFYHDVTRGKVPTLETLKELADRAAFYKLNQIQLYVEHTFAFKNLTEVWMGADPLTAEEIILFDEYCKERHIELVPSLSTFGHLYMALRNKSFRHLCELEIEDKPYSWYDRMAHHTLDVSNPESIEFVKNMLEEFIPLFSSDKFNICCDETFDLGEGKNKALADKVGKGQLYVDFLNKVIDIVKAQDKKVMFWGDIILHHPELFDQIPKDVICLNWNYAADAVEINVEIMAKSGLQQYVCPGVGGWNMIMNSFESAFPNIKTMVNHGKKHKAVGVLNTDWGDYGHINLFGNSMPGMIYGAALSWNPDYDEEFSKVDESISFLEYGDKTESLVGILREISRQQTVNHGEIVWWKDNKFQGFPEISEEKKKEYFTADNEKIIKAHDRALELSEELINVSKGVSSLRTIDIEEFYVSARGVALLNALTLVIRKYDFGREESAVIYSPKEMASLLEKWIADYSKVWRARNKESELYRIRDFYMDICDYLKTL